MGAADEPGQPQEGHRPQEGPEGSLPRQGAEGRATLGGVGSSCGPRSAQGAPGGGHGPHPLTVAQIDRVLRQVTGERGRRGSLIERIDDLRIAVNRVLDDPEFNDTLTSRSLLVGMRVWASYPLSGEDKGVNEVAGELGMSPSTAHRYLNTMTMIGLLERTPRRRYRLPVLDEPDADHGAPHA